ncbi:DUF3168 domain-containing protein [Methylopila sp. M107]|uniref:DUF3168 domain-containing protein n=1 Tax=Methylopila sp. M107 TaxID=1101190 RepID=UPI00037C9912|nr:DUF3168 domain-containing protein [Methylopila sp. M107]
MSGAATALRKAVRARLASDAALSALLGGPKVHDEPPRALPPPYVALGDCESRDVSGDDTPAEEHALLVEVWSREGGLSETLKISARIVVLLDGASLTLAGFRLASLGWVFTDAGHVAEQAFRRATLKFRALTEPE